MSVREHMDRLGNLQPFGQQAEWTVALYDWMLAVTAALETKGCPCGNVRNRADNTRAFCPHCNGIDAKGQS